MIKFGTRSSTSAVQNGVDVRVNGNIFKKGLSVALLPIILASCNLQDRLLYFPSRNVPVPEELARKGLRFWPERLDGYRGFSGELSGAGARGTVVVFHGNAATAAERSYYLDPFQKLGYRVILAEYPGYGGRTGELGERPFVSDARETVRLARMMYGDPVYLVGESLGCAVAAAVVGVGETGIAGMILFTPWATLEKLAKEKFPLLPVRWLLTDRYDTVSNLSRFTGKVAVVAAERDDLVPPHHARELAGSFPGTKKIWTLPHAGHNDWPDRISVKTWREIIDFM